MSLRHVLDVSPGFEPQNVIVAPIARSGAETQALVFYQTLLERVRALPGVDAFSDRDAARWASSVDDSDRVRARHAHRSAGSSS